MDHFSKFTSITALPDQMAETVAAAMIHEFFSHLGLPRRILTDQGRNFESALTTSLCAQLSIDKSRTSAYRPQTNGMNERFHSTLHQMLRNYIAPDQSNWDEFLPHVQLAYNTSVHEGTKFTPYFLMHGREAILPYECTQGLSPTLPPNMSAYVSDTLQ